MNNRLRFILLVLLIALSSIVLILNRKEPVKRIGCPGNDIDLTKMLQYGEKVQDIKVVDRYGRVFDFGNYRQKPLLFFFIQDDPLNILAFNDSLQKHLSTYLVQGLKIIYVNYGKLKSNDDYMVDKLLDIYCDTNNFEFFTLFKVYNHYACIILNTERTVCLSTISAITPIELKEIIKYKENCIFK